LQFGDGTGALSKRSFDQIPDLLIDREHISVIEMLVSRGIVDFGMAQKLANHQQRFRQAGRLACKTVAQVVKSHALQPCLLA
jgi:hypothetical protein